MAVITINKTLGETMGQLLQRVKSENKISDAVSVTYAGRLDPAATGRCIFLSGNDVFKKDEYLARDKTYRVSVLIGVRTDTDDLLGLVESVSSDQLVKHCPNVIDGFRGLPKTIMQPPHEFSGFRVAGQPMWEHKRAGVQKKMPHVAPKKRTIYSIQYNDSQSVTRDELLGRVESICKTVAGDFRQDEIKASWKQSLQQLEYPVLEFTVRVSSGTYIRSLVHTVSADIRVPLVLYALDRLEM
jgi:tRNA pseudouridine(55) synthase